MPPTISATRNSPVSASGGREPGLVVGSGMHMGATDPVTVVMSVFVSVIVGIGPGVPVLLFAGAW